MLQRVLIDKTIEVLFQCADHCGRAPEAGVVGEALHPLLGKAMDPFAQRGIGKVERVRDRLQAMPLTTSRTACARRKPRTSLGCFKKRSEEAIYVCARA